MDEENKKNTININTEKIKRSFSGAADFFKNKKIQTSLVIVLLILVIIFGVLIRTQNLGLLVDQTTGKQIPTALDPFYFLRIAETIVEQGGLPPVDVMRYPSANLGFIHEILPQAIVFLYNIGKIFDSEITLQFVDIISPVIFFALGLAVFFFLIYFLTKSKVTAIISSAFLAFLPPYLYRTMAGFSDHEAIGMFAFFLVLLGYGLSLKFLEKENKKDIIKVLLFGLLTGFLSAFAVASWGGGANFIFMIIPLSFGLFWVIKSQNLEETNKKQLQSLLIFYLSWIVFSILSGLLYDFSFMDMISRVLLRPSSIISVAVLLFLLVDFSLIRFKNKIKFVKKEKLEKYRVLYSLLILVLIGLIFLILQGNLFSFISNTFNRFIHPFGAGRTGLTVAENKQPFLEDWVGQIGKIFFWFFYLGMLFFGFNMSKGIGKKKNKILFFLLWIAVVSGILFSRISPTSLFNGTNFISKFIYFGSLILFVGYFIWLYFRDRIEIK
ncbi:MAG TPA: STT3 domain-containing protein, partial [Bacillota bacterium]|nr:STT3 domain-containing protein [Bacillota bacterium]